MKTCLIISGGAFCALPKSCAFDYVIACDHGYDYAKRMGIRPDIILGDLDSVEDRSGAQTLPLLRYPEQKDDSDTMLAVKYALQEGFLHVIVTCALGGRLDHTIANLQALSYVAKHGGVAELTGDGEFARTFTGGSLELPRREGYSLSLFALSDTCEGLKIEGALYDAEQIDLFNTFPLGLSNGWKDDTVKITMKKGILLIVESLLCC